MPKYLKGDRHTFYITNQDAVLYPARVGGSSAAGAELKLPRIRERLCLPHLPEHGPVGQPGRRKEESRRLP